MLFYLLKSAACLAILFLFYKVVLENTSLHVLKRFFLLGSAIAATIIPLVTFTEYVEVTPMVSVPVTSYTGATPISVAEPTHTDYLPYVLLSVYLLGVLFFSFRFGRNLWRILHSIKHHPVLKKASILYVLLSQKTTPHSFFNYIFCQKSDYEAGLIPDEVLTHEKAHIRQNHSWDIIFIEVFQILFWFNPLCHFIKRSIRLNHEFLADDAVLKQGAETATYQKILLDFSSRSDVQQLAHAINYSSIKKRFTLMKKQTSKRAAWVKSLLLIPLVALLLYGFSDTEKIAKQESLPEVSNPEVLFDSYDNRQTDNSNSVHNYTARNVDIRLLENKEYLVNGQAATRQNIAEIVGYFNQDIDRETRKRIVNIHLSSDQIISNEEVKFIFDSLRNYGFYRLVAPNQTIITSKGNKPYKTTQSDQEFSYAKNFIEGAKRNGKKALVIIIVNDNITVNGKASYLKRFRKDIDEATKEWSQDDYINAVPSILLNNVSAALRNELTKEFEKTKFSQMKGGMSLLPDPPPAPPKPEKAPDAPTAPAAEPKGSNDRYIPNPPPPPPSPEPLPAPDPAAEIISLAKRGAIFYSGPHEISSEEAVEMVRRGNNISIQVEETDLPRPIVRLNNC